MGRQLNRRRFLAGVGAAGAASVAGGAAIASATDRDGTPSEPNAARPNIVVIVADDLGYSDIGCFGSEIATPHLDALADRGQRFTQMYNNARCCPSRASLLTGLYPTQAGLGWMTDQTVDVPGYRGFLRDSSVTFAEALGLADYQSSISGKWHVAHWLEAHKPSWAHNRGFDRSWVPVGADYWNPRRYRDGVDIGRPNDDLFYTTDGVTRHAVDSIRDFAADGDPFVSYVSYTAPHYPLAAWPEDIERYRGRYSEGWEALRAQRFERQRQLGVVDPNGELPDWDPAAQRWAAAQCKDWQDARMAIYAAQITAMDRGIGQIMATLEERGIAENTLVLFLGDNGGTAEFARDNEMPDNGCPDVPSRENPLLMSYGQGWATASDTPFRKWKRWMHEGGIATPCIASWPGTLPAGGIDHRTLHVMDLMPTFLELADADYPTEYNGNRITPLEGVSFAPLLTGEAPDWTRGKEICWEHTGNVAIRDGDWKLVAEHEPGQEPGWQLYDMANDRAEVQNLAPDKPGVVDDLSRRWAGWKQRVGVLDWDGDQKTYV